MSRADGGPLEWDYRANHSRIDGVGSFLESSAMRSLMADYAEIGVALFRDRAKKVSGENARLVRTYTTMVTSTARGQTTTRWTATIESYSDHAVAREFGNSRNLPEGNLRAIIPILEGL